MGKRNAKQNSLRTHYILTLFIVSVFMSGCSHTVLLSSSRKPNRVVLSNFNVTLRHFDTDQFNAGSYASLVVALSEPSFSSADLIQVHRSFNSKQNAHIKQQLDSVYTGIQRNFKSIGINLLSADYLANKNEVPFGPYGFPHSSDIKSNAQQADAAVDITLHLESQGFTVTHTGPNTTELQYRPRLTMELTMMSHGGQIIWKDQEVSISSRMVDIQIRKTGVTNYDVQSEPALSDMVNSALKKMISRLPTSLRTAS